MAKTIERSALVLFTPQQMFELVNDIEAYPEFMDGCIGSKVISRDETTIVARLDLRKGGFEQSFVTRNHLQPFSKIDMTLVDGPFEQLDGCWTFDPLGDLGCKVKLSLTFEFKNKLIAMAASKWFESVGNQLVDSIAARAKKKFG